MGRAFNDSLRGEADFGSYDWIRTQWVGDDATFNRIGGRGRRRSSEERYRFL